ncbi:MAG: methyltransferase domain-containing protein [Candidatus Aegiribacteria sp.]|nr:methyltransferase domain-containing protein [Candidatus Aegiribacteria sp.]
MSQLNSPLSGKGTVLISNPWRNEKFASESLDSIDRKFLPGTKQEVDFIIKELEADTGAAILDIGCGAGRHSIELAKSGYVVTGIDVSPTMLANAKQRAEQSNVKLVLLEDDILKLSDFLNGQTDTFYGAICICESGLGSLGWQKDLAVLRVIHNCLSDGAKLILTTFNGLKKYRGERIKAKSFDFLNGLVHWQLPDDWDNTGEKLEEFQRVYIPSEMKMLCEMAGFSDVEILGCKPGEFKRKPLEPDDTEMMIVCKKSADNH